MAGTWTDGIRPRLVAGAATGAGLVVVALIPLTPIGIALAVAASAVLVLTLAGAALATLVVARTHGAESLSFACLAAVFALWACTRAQRLVSLARDEPVEMWAALTPVWIAVACLGVAASVLLYVHHRERRSWAGPIDAAVIAIGVALLAWSFVYGSDWGPTAYAAAIAAVAAGLGSMLLWRRSSVPPWLRWGLVGLAPMMGDVVVTEWAERSARSELRVVAMGLSLCGLGCLAAAAAGRLRSGPDTAPERSDLGRRPSRIVRALPAVTLLAGIAALTYDRGLVGLLAIAAAALLVARVLQSLATVEHLLEERSHWALVDPLTGVANRRRFSDELPALADEARQSGTPAAVVALDLDHFKAANDVGGHAAGDALLREVAAAITGVLRERDRLFRLGGDEFVVLLPATDLTDAQHIAERLRLVVAEAASDLLPDGPAVTTSIGVAELPMDVGDGRSTPAVADRALYAAKMQGRDRVVVAEADGAGG